MKSLGYGNGYEYNPAKGYERGCTEGYMPRNVAGKPLFDTNDVEPGWKLQFGGIEKPKFTDFQE